MVDEMTDVGNVAQLALVLRYVTDTGVKERFLKFENVTTGKQTDDIAAHNVSSVKEYECCLDKVVVQCYNGTAMHAD